MTSRATEQRHDRSVGLDTLPGGEIAAILLDGQIAAVRSVARAIPDLDRAAVIAAEGLRAGGRLVYAGAGSSGLMAAADAAELGGTYGIAADRILISMAGGIPRDAHMPGDVEDDREGAAAVGARLGPADIVVVVTASGSTPYALALAEAARSGGARVIGIANNPDAQLFGLADVAILLPTPPEVIAGSTRMGAGSAQKAALNIFSTLLGIKLGQVHDGLMVGVVADNGKLRERAAGIVATIAEVDRACAAESLSLAKGAVKAAILMAKGAGPDEALRLLDEEQGFLRPALARLAGSGPGQTETGPGSRKSSPTKGETE